MFIYRQLSELENVRVERELIQSIEEDAYKFLSELGAPPPRRIHQGSSRSINQQLKTMRIDIERALEPRLDFYIEVQFYFLIKSKHLLANIWGIRCQTSHYPKKFFCQIQI